MAPLLTQEQAQEGGTHAATAISAQTLYSKLPRSVPSSSSVPGAALGLSLSQVSHGQQQGQVGPPFLCLLHALSSTGWGAPTAPHPWTLQVI